MLSQFACLTQLKLSMISLRSQYFENFLPTKSQLDRIISENNSLVSSSNFTLLLYHVRERELIKRVAYNVDIECLKVIQSQATFRFDGKNLRKLQQFKTIVLQILQKLVTMDKSREWKKFAWKFKNPFYETERKGRWK